MPGALAEGRVRGKATHRCNRIHPLPRPLPQGRGGFVSASTRPACRHRERGTALIFALVMLLLLTLLGITAITTSSLQEKMAGNMRDQYMAQQAGDSILFDGQSFVLNQQYKPTPSCPPSTGPSGYIWDSECMPATVAADVGAPAGANWWLTANDAWWLANGNQSSVAIPTGLVFQQPRYIVEKIEQIPDEAEIGSKAKKYTFYFRATGWSVGASDYARGLYQGIYTKRSDTYPN